MQFDENDLAGCFGRGTLMRGIDLCEDHRVSLFGLNARSNLVSGTVRTPGGEAHKVFARLERSAKDRLRVSGSCSCRGGPDCAHTAALLWKALENDTAVLPEEPSRSGPWLHDTALRDIARQQIELAKRHEESKRIEWVRCLGAAVSGADPRAAIGKDAFVLSYRLDVRAYHAAWNPFNSTLVVLPVVAKLLKRGGWGTDRAFSWSSLSSRTPPGYLTPADEKLITALAAGDGRLGSYTSFEGGVEFHPSRAEEPLGRLLDSGKCYWRDLSGKPLARGAGRRGRLAWRLKDTGAQEPFLEFGGADFILLPVNPPWAIDLAARECFPVETGLEAEALAAFLNAPPIPPEVSGEIRNRIEDLGSPFIPLPETIAIENEILETEPVPHLTLLGRALPPYYGTPSALAAAFPTARLSFRYGEFEIAAGAPGSEILSASGTRLRRVRRNPASETRHCERLEALDLLPPDALMFRPEGVEALGDGGAAGKEGDSDFIPESDDPIGHMVRLVALAVPKLRAEGWIVDIAPSFPANVLPDDAALFVRVADRDRSDWFDLDLGIELDGETISLLPALVNLIRRRDSPLTRESLDALDEKTLFMVTLPGGRFLPIPAGRIRILLGTVLDLHSGAELDSKGRLGLNALHAAAMADFQGAAAATGIRWLGESRFIELGRRLSGFQGIEVVHPPAGLQAELRPYQLEGLAWLQFLRENDLSGILADDMGLGKTVQALAHLLIEKQSGRADRPSLIVAPTSVIVNWKREAQRFAPSLTALVLQGIDRKRHFERIEGADLILTTYPLLWRDKAILLDRDYHLFILDEAQFVKNHESRGAAVAQQVRARHRLCLSGTPIENRLLELWSLFNILMPGLLGDARSFKRDFVTPIEKHGNDSRRAQLAARVKPFLLRRTKDRVASELPAKTETIRAVELTGAQRDLYEAIRLAMHRKVQQEIGKKGIERSRIVILDALLKLRQVCCDPRLVKTPRAREVRESVKLEALLEMLEEMLAEGRRVLLFSQFTSLLDLLEPEVKKREWPFSRLTGETTDRRTPVELFQSGRTRLFLISLRAGGTGLNLTAADTVILYDPWWNPAVEDQAIDRAHRIGQDKPVFVYKLIVAGSVEEKILALQSRKRALAAGMLGDGSKAALPLTAEDLEALFRPLD